MQISLLRLESPAAFERLCQALLAEEFSRFQAFSQPDLGMDGYDSDSGTVFQVYYPERSPRRDKMAIDLAKARDKSWPCNRWVLLVPQNPTPHLLQWLRQQEQSLPFRIEVWGQTVILKLLRKHAAVRDEYFPTGLEHELRRISKGQPPKPGDATAGTSITATQAADIREQIDQLTDESAARKRRKPKPIDYRREFSEFNSHFRLSSYDRLPATEFSRAREYLERKLYGRRNADTARQQRHRYLAGIKGMQRELGMSDGKYRSLLVEFAGVSSTTQMQLEQLKRLFERFRQLQQTAAAKL